MEKLPNPNSSDAVEQNERRTFNMRSLAGVLGEQTAKAFIRPSQSEDDMFGDPPESDIPPLFQNPEHARDGIAWLLKGDSIERHVRTRGPRIGEVAVHSTQRRARF